MMKFTLKTIGLLSTISLILVLIFFDNIKGYLRFKQYCETEGGLRVYEQLERNVGWLAVDKYSAQASAVINNIGFVRYKNEHDGKVYDLRYVGGNPTFDNAFESVPFDGSKSIKYIFRNINKSIGDELRLKLHGKEILDVKRNKVLVRYYFYTYENFNRDNTILDMPSVMYCSNDTAYFGSKVGSWLDSINASFKN